MNLFFLRDRQMSAKARDLVDFDAGSLRQVVAAEHGSPPATWLADPDQYEQGDRILRDSTSARLLAYSPQDQILYATDGCNSCAHRLKAKIDDLPPDALRAFASESAIPSEMLERLIALESEIRGE